MLALLISILNIFFVSLGFGLILNRLAGIRLFNLPESILNGFILSVSLAQFIALFAPVNAHINLLFIAIAATSLYIHRSVMIQVRFFPVPVWLIPGLVLLLAHTVLMMNAFSGIPGTWFYHSQSIKWIEEFGSVYGLGNFFSNLAYHSNVFIANALFGPRWMLGYPAFVVNSFLWILSGLIVIQRIPQEIAKKNYLRIILDWLVLILIYRYFHSWLSSSSQDPAAALLLFLLYLGIRSAGEEGGKQSGMLTVVVLAGFLMTIKLSHCLFVFPALFWLIRMKERKSQILTAILFGFVVLPFFARNFILSGYVLYPFPALDLFAVDWKIPYDDVRFEQLLIRSWSSDPALPLNGQQDFLAFAWLKSWLAQIGILYNVLIGMTILGSMLLIYRPLRQLLFKSRLGLFYVFLLFALVVWFFSAPSPRFVVGILLLAVLIPFEILLKLRMNLKIGRTQMILVFYGILIFGFSAARNTTGEALAQQGSWLKPPQPPEPKVNRMNLNNIDFNYVSPVDLKSYDFPLPVSPQYREGLLLRGSTIGDGFRTDLKLRNGGPEIIPRFYQAIHPGIKADTLH